MTIKGIRTWCYDTSLDRKNKERRERRKFIRDLVEINANDSIFDSYVYAGVGKK